MYCDSLVACLMFPILFYWAVFAGGVYSFEGYVTLLISLGGTSLEFFPVYSADICASQQSNPFGGPC
jgi:hypothetical protein